MAKQKKKRQRRHSGERVLPARLRQELDHVQTLMRRGDLEEARRRLYSLEQRYPQYPEVWDMAVALHPRDPFAVLQATEHLLALNADDDVAAHNQIVALMRLFGPFLAYERAQEFLRKWPNSPYAPKIAELVDFLPRAINESIALVRNDFPHLSVEQAREVMRLHELVRYHLALQQEEKAEAAAQALLRIEPRFAPGVNNLATLYATQGRYEEALQTLRQAHESGVKNAYTLAFLVEILYMLGKDDDVQRFAAELRTTPSATLDHAFQKMVAWALLGEDERVLEAFEEAKATREFKYDVTGLVGEVYHLAAAAHMRLGQEGQARGLWKRARQQGNSRARTCLDDFSRPPEERHIPWYFDLHSLPAFFRESEMEALKAALERRGGAAQRAVRRRLQDSPHMPRLFAVWLDRGGPDARTLAFHLLTVADDPRYYPILAAFGQSTHGPDDLRMEAIGFLLQRRYFSQPSIKVWQGGKWHDIHTEIIDFEIVDTPTYKYSWDLQVLTEEALFAMSHGEFRRAELLLRAALGMMPEDTTIRHNLAVALIYQGRREEALPLLEALRREHPEYGFARATLAELALMEGNVEQARAWLGTLHDEPLKKKGRWHVTEYATFIQSLALVGVAMDDRENALHALELLREMLVDEFDRPDLVAQVTWLQQQIRLGRAAVEIAKEMISPPPSQDAERLALLEGTSLRIGQRVRVLADADGAEGGRGKAMRRTGWLLDVKRGRLWGSTRVRVAWDATTMKALGKSTKNLDPEEEEQYKRGEWVPMTAVEPLGN